MWAAEPLDVQLAASPSARPLITFLLLHGHVRPGYGYLLGTKVLEPVAGAGRIRAGPDLDRFLDAARRLGFSERHRLATASQAAARLLIQSGRPLDQLVMADLDGFAAACREREERTGERQHHYLMALQHAHRVLFHLRARPPTAHRAVPRCGR